jgi:hypothetical protein
MSQSRAEAERLMEQQHYPVDYTSPQDRGLADPDEDEELLEECPCCGQLTITEDNKCYSCGWRSN